MGSRPAGPLSPGAIRAHGSWLSSGCPPSLEPSSWPLPQWPGLLAAGPGYHLWQQRAPLVPLLCQSGAGRVSCRWGQGCNVTHRAPPTMLISYCCCNKRPQTERKSVPSHSSGGQSLRWASSGSSPGVGRAGSRRKSTSWPLLLLEAPTFLGR